MEKLTYATEEDKLQALEGFDSDRGNEEELQRIMDAEIVPVSSQPDQIDQPDEQPAQPEPKPDDSQSQETPQAPQDSQDSQEGTVSPVPSKPDSQPAGDAQQNEYEALKAKVEEQQKFIKENLMTQGHVRTLEEKIAELTKAPPQQTEKPPKPPEFRQSNLSELMAKRNELLNKYKNPEDRLESEYVTTMDDINSGLMQEIDALNNNMNIIKSQSETTKETVETYNQTRQQEDQVAKWKKEQENQQSAVESFSQSRDEFKLSKPFNEVNRDYANYQREVANVYWGQDVSGDTTKINEAMSQLQAKSPNLTTRLQAANIPVEPTDEMKKMLALCEVWDHWQGYRKNPTTGDYNRGEDGKILPLTRYDVGSGKYVNDTFPNIDAAYNDQAVKSGYYMNQVINAKIQGGKEALRAANSRSDAAVEMDNTGGAQQSAEEIMNELENIDVQAIMAAYFNGNKKPFEDYNKKMASIKMPTLPEPNRY